MTRRYRLKAWHMSLCILALAALPAPAQAAPAAAPWVARHDLTSAKYQAAFDTYVKSGYRLTAVSGYVKPAGLRYAALWRKVLGPAWAARHGLSSAAYQKAFDDFAKDGYRLVYVNGYEVDGVNRYAAIWEKRGGPPLVARHGLTAAQYQAEFDARTKSGYRLLHVSGYSRGGSDRYAAIFEKSAGPAGIAHHRLTSDGYQKKFDEYGKAGYRLKLVSGYRADGSDRYAAIWEKVGGPPGRARHGIPHASYQRVFDVDRFQGYYPVLVQGFTSGSSPRFNTIWESTLSQQDLGAIRGTFDGFLTKQKVAGLSVAIARDGRLLYASGFGLADKEKQVGLDVRHRLRIGSVSKSITSAAAFQLIEDGKLSGMARKVFGSGGILSDVKVPASMKALENATVGQFLEHTSGLPGASSGRNLRDPVNCGAGDLGKRLEAELARHAKASADAGLAPLLGAPGTVSDYSNFSHMVVEDVIETLSKASYESYVRDRVLGPSGLTQPRLFKIGAFDAASGEAKHYLTNGDYAEYRAVDTCELEPPGVGAGGWAMSALDLLRWYVSVDGRPGREILTGAHYAEMLAPSAVNAGYGRSWILGNWGWCGPSSAIRQGHNGGLAGGFANLFELGDGYSFAVIGNQNTGTGTCSATTGTGTAIACGSVGQWACSDDSVGRLLGILNTIDWPQHDIF